MQLEKIKISITDACEGTCEYCYRGPIRGRMHLSKESVLRIMEAGVGHAEKVHISGGNPLLHPDFDAFCERLQQLPIKAKLSANPGLIARKQEMILNTFDEFGFSLESSDSTLHNEIRGIRADFEDLMRLLDVDFGSRATVTMVLTGRNSGDVDAGLELLKTKNVKKIKVQTLEPSLMPKAGRDSLIQNDSGGTWRRELSELVHRHPEVDFISRELPKAHVSTCTYMLSNPHIKEDGTVYPCCGVDEERVIGNVYSQTLQEIMTGHRAQHAGLTTWPYDSCKDCVFAYHYN